MNSDIVVVRSYPTEIAAELARIALEAAGISAVVASQNAAGLLRYQQGVQLVVRHDEVAAASEVLAALDDDAPSPEGEKP